MTGVITPEPIIDRIAPTREPAGRIVMRQNWHHLLFLHWTVPANALQRLLPPGLTLDTFEGQAYVGLVPFTMTGVRPVWSPAVPALSSFHEVNVRTYVHRGGRDPGVWFFSLDAANAVAVRLARAWFKLSYFFAHMSLVIGKGMQWMLPPDTPQPIDYKSERLWPGPTPANCAVNYTPDGPVTPAQPGTLEHFLAERYILYSYANQRLYTGRVHHTPYPLQSATLHELDENLTAAAGITRPDDAPHILYAQGVNVRIYPLRRCL